MLLSVLFSVLFLFLVLLLFFLELGNIAVPDIPLCNLPSEIVSNGRTCSSTSLFDLVVNRLNLTTFVVELVSHSLLDSLDVFATAGLLLFCLTSELLEVLFTVLLDLLLDLVLIVACMDIVSFQREVSDHLIDAVIQFILSLLIVIHDFIWGSLGVDDDEGAVDTKV